ncbi:MAG: lysostaphin resistance A-like protein [Candidatus Promineifilaceae bacterium]
MELVLAFLGVAAVILAVNVLERRGVPLEKRLLDWLMFAFNGLVLLTGLALLAAPEELLLASGQALPPMITDFDAFGWIVALMGAWGGLCSLAPFRRWLGRFLPLDPASAVQALALVFSGYLAGQTALALSQGGLAGLVQTAEPASIGLFVLSELALAAAAFLGAGLLVRRDWPGLFRRLGLTRPAPGQLLIGTALIPVLVVLQAVAALLYAQLNPSAAGAVEDLTGLLLENMDTVWEWLLLAVAAGVGEEILFRGALQPRFGLALTSVLFALVHVQYGFTAIQLFIVLLALILGLIRRHFNTTTAVYVHAGYNFILGLLALVAASFPELMP